MIDLINFNEELLRVVWQLGYREEKPEWSELNAPYFDEYESYETFEEFYDECGEFYMDENRKCIIYDNRPVGMINRYWKDKRTRWLEVGILIYDEKEWNKGIGSKALRMWIEKTFDDYPELLHIGLTTWSGNMGMINCAKKIGMREEALIRKVRFYKDYYYDSISYGILRDEL